MRLYLLRHGETDYNRQRRNQGRIDIPLNDRGRELAEQTAKGLAKIPFDLCLCSPLKRARETAEIILKGREVPVLIDERLIEVSFGVYEGKCWDPATWDQGMPGDFRCFFTDPGRYQAPDDGETLEELKERLGGFLKDIFARKELQDSRILVSTHGAALAAMLADIKGLPVSEFWGDGCSKNCGVTELQVTDGVPEIISENVIYY